jgi:hypothetical protein
MKSFLGLLLFLLVLAAAAALLSTTERGARELDSLRALVSGPPAPKASGVMDKGARADDDDDGFTRLTLIDGVLALELPAEVQRQSGIVTAVLEPAEFTAERTATGHVLDVQPLVDLRARRQAAQSELMVAEAALARSREAFQRLSQLHQEGGNIAARQLEEARAQLRADEARVAGARQQLDSLRSEALLVWGKELVSTALSGESEIFQRLIDRQEVLVLIGLRAGETLPPGAEMIYIAAVPDRAQAQAARLVAPAPRTDAALQGETYYFRTAAERLRTGMRVTAWIPEGGAPEQGVLVPAEAVVWHAGKPWVYVQRDDAHFFRVSLIDPKDLGSGWFVHDSLAAGDRVVLSGGQMLLSEEFRWQIPDEDEKP